MRSSGLQEANRLIQHAPDLYGHEFALMTYDLLRARGLISFDRDAWRYAAERWCAALGVNYRGLVELPISRIDDAIRFLVLTAEPIDPERAPALTHAPREARALPEAPGR